MQHLILIGWNDVAQGARRSLVKDLVHGIRLWADRNSVLDDGGEVDLDLGSFYISQTVWGSTKLAHAITNATYTALWYFYSELQVNNVY